MYPGLVEKVVTKYRADHPELYVFEGPSLDGEGLFYTITRPLSLKEYEIYATLALRDEGYSKTYVCNTAVLEVFNSARNRFAPLKDLPVGLYEEAFQLILESSDFSPEALSSNLDRIRGFRSSTQLQAIAFICRAFPNITPKDVESMGAVEFTKHICLAEIVFEAKGMENPFFNIVIPGTEVSEKTKNSNVLRSIAKEAKENDRIMGS